MIRSEMILDIFPDVHHHFIHRRRRNVLSRQLTGLISQASSVLDIGCGDGMLGERLTEERPDLQIRGIDKIVRERVNGRIDSFDGTRLPYADNSFDVTLLVDVLHHAENPFALFKEAVRVGTTLLGNRKYAVISTRLSPAEVSTVKLSGILMTASESVTDRISFASLYVSPQ